MNELALFAGSGGGILGGLLLGWRTVAAVEIEDYPTGSLLQRQADGILPRFPIWDGIETFDGRPWRGKVDIITGGFPCQDISVAGKAAGIEGERSGLWSEMARIVGEVRPTFVLVENSPTLTSRGLDRVLGDLESMGYHTRRAVLGAYHAGAPHKRERIWILAFPRHWGRRDVGTAEGGEGLPGEWAAHPDPPGRSGEQPAAIPHADSEQVWDESRGIRGQDREDKTKSRNDGIPRPMADRDGGGQQGIGIQEHRGLEREGGDLPDGCSPGGSGEGKDVSDSESNSGGPGLCESEQARFRGRRSRDSYSEDELSHAIVQGLEINQSGEGFQQGSPIVGSGWWDVDPADIPDPEYGGRERGDEEGQGPEATLPPSEGEPTDPEYEGPPSSEAGGVVEVRGGGEDIGVPPPEQNSA